MLLPERSACTSKRRAPKGRMAPAEYHHQEQNETVLTLSNITDSTRAGCIAVEDGSGRLLFVVVREFFAWPHASVCLISLFAGP